MLLNTLIICIYIQLILAFYFAMGQVKLDSQYMWMERSLILSFISNILIVYGLLQSGITLFLDNGALIFLWGVGAITPITFMYLTYSFWIKHKLLVRNGYIKIYTFLR